MNTDSNSIQCPRCGEEINVNAAIFKRLETRIKEEFSVRLEDEKKALAAKADTVARAEKALADEKRAMTDKIAREVETGLQSERLKLEQKIKEVEWRNGVFKLLRGVNGQAHLLMTGAANHRQESAIELLY